MQILRWLLFPFTILYTWIILLRNLFYDLGIFKSRQFSVKTIAIGNLSIGGAGKSPLTQKLIAYFQTRYQVATLSRGYGRKTKGFRFVSLSDTADQSGDEPLQFKKNFPQISIAVDENRAEGIEILQQDHNLILLDDAFQHRKIRAKCNILVFDYQSILRPIFLLPTGNYRDTFNQTKRASCILINKCPDHIPDEAINKITAKIRRYSLAPIYYSKINYLMPIQISETGDSTLRLSEQNILLVTGIANPLPLQTYLAKHCQSLEHLSFPDHHHFKAADYQKMIQAMGEFAGSKKALITTEKDAQRLRLEELPNIPIYYLPIELQILQEAEFLSFIEKTVNES